MGRDRAACLIIRSGVDAGPDYSDYATWDADSRLAELITFLELERRENISILEEAYTRLDNERSRLFTIRAGEEYTSSNLQRLALVRHQILSLRMPWCDWGPPPPVGKLDAATEQHLWSQWRRHFGDPNSEEVKRMIRERIVKNTSPGQGVQRREL